MSTKDDVLSQLVAMSRDLGDPANDYVILGEGNTSAKVDDETFFVKASGTTLRDIGPEGFVEVRFAAILDLLDKGDLSDLQVKEGLEVARADPRCPARPSVETFLHALLLSIEDVRFVGHTHPTAVNIILCSQRGEDAIRGRLFPDEIVCCGVAPVWVPYTDPGVPLALEVKRRVERHIADLGERPKAILMQNHGLIALGATPKEVLSTTAMWVKTARVLVGTYSLGGPHYLSEENVARIHTRPDEKYRQKGITGA
jgi:rhamnose utilization protein RhaD (predicted bifunctional aldolase and dehydrogenase)